jgi:hypothetical protein
LSDDLFLYCFSMANEPRTYKSCSHIKPLRAEVVRGDERGGKGVVPRAESS